MQRTDLNPPVGQSVVKAQPIPASNTSQISTSGTFVNNTRTISVKVSQCEVRLRYAPVHPKPNPEQQK